MSRYRESLPQLNNRLFITDGGLETTLIFHEGLELPYFAAFDLLRTAEGEQILKDYYRKHAEIAIDNGVGFILESATWRASAYWGNLMGYTDIALDAINRQAVEMLASLREELETSISPMVISGCVGTGGDGYNPDSFMTVEEARIYHSSQIRSFASSAADMVTAMTINYVEEAAGIVQAAREENMPVVISFTVETDGKLPTGQSLEEAIEQVDAETRSAAAYYMINCAHPTHFDHELTGDAPWLQRIMGIRANASCKSHAELDESTELDDGDPVELGDQYKTFKQQLQQLTVFGGCCGTDHRHVEAICKSTAGIQHHAQHYH
jgi:S-methylmethionine-dependent homocysteine/selenocysteine methylase